MHAHAEATGLLPLTVMWFGMMAAMMAPTAWPWVRAYDRFGHAGAARNARAVAAGTFAGGYLAAWLAYSAMAALLQWTLVRFGVADATGPAARWLGALLLAGAGLFQLAPFKQACLAHCRNPVTYFLARWQDGPAGGFRMGLGHGLYCVGCCWALMLTALGAGMMNLWWMAALSAAALAEQTLPWGARLRVPLGVALVVFAALRLWA